MKQFVLLVLVFAAQSAFASDEATPGKFTCQMTAEKIVAAILSAQNHFPVTVATLHASRVRDDVGNLVETFNIQGYKTAHGKKEELGAFSRVEFSVEEDSCTLFSYSLPSAG